MSEFVIICLALALATIWASCMGVLALRAAREETAIRRHLKCLGLKPQQDQVWYPADGTSVLGYGAFSKVRILELVPFTDVPSAYVRMEVLFCEPGWTGWGFHHVVMDEWDEFVKLHQLWTQTS